MNQPASGGQYLVSVNSTESPPSPSRRRTVELIRNGASVHSIGQAQAPTPVEPLGPVPSIRSSSASTSIDSPTRQSNVNRKTSGRNSTGSMLEAGFEWRPILLATVESKAFVALTTLLTIYALVGEDIKLMSTDKDSDIIFMVITCVCMGIFTVEIILASFGKDDYKLSFFFWLDVVSTASLILDIPQVNEFIVGSDEELQNVRGSKTARLGARLGRIVRVLRLVRILKLYKAVFEWTQVKKLKKAKKRKPGEDDEWAEMELTQKEEHRESLVGMKLSELTTRRVIFIVLFMMLLLPILRVDASAQFATSAQYGADLVYDAFRKLEQEETRSARLTYETTLLKYVYSHSKFTRNYDGTSSVFWFGIAATDQATLEEKVAFARLNASTVSLWESTKINNAEAIEDDDTLRYGFGPMPPTQQPKIGDAWVTSCPYLEKYKRLGVSLLDVEIDDFNDVTVDYLVRCPENLRRIERKKVTPLLQITKQQHEDWHFAFYFDLRPFVFEESVYSLLITLFVLASLLVTSLQFAADANHLVLHPVENMMHKVETIRDNPLMATKVADEEFKVEQITKARQSRATRSRLSLDRISEMFCCMGREASTELMETVILEKTIIKLGSLLALGFGEAGSHIIESNLGGIATASVNAMVEGTRVDCIIGTLRIRDFSLATEVLQTKVMTFVNQIAEIVHGVVNEFHGAANKNNGDTYLVVWGISDMDFEVQQRMADMSVVAFARILAAVHRSPVLATYREHPGLQQRLGKGCRVNLTSGLHFGWAIEGAVGSEFKIDASYLSPNVSIAESIERATQIYGVSVLISESVMRICTPAIAAKGRLIDRITMTGSPSPFNLYALDLDVRSLTVDQLPSKQFAWNSRTRLKVREFLESEKEQKLHFEASMADIFNSDDDISLMRFRYTLEFAQIFNMGYQNYSQGEWQVAQRLLSRTKIMLGVEDGPSAALLSYMERPSGYHAPEKWAGIRELSEAELS